MRQVSSEGVVYWRQGVSPQCPAGQVWVQLHNPDTSTRSATELAYNPFNQ